MMVNRCVVFGCGNVASEVCSLHELPTAAADKKRRQRWRAFVKRTRAHWDVSEKGTCFICSEHFSVYDFINKIQFDMGLCTKLLLNSTAVPSIYPSLVNSTSSQPVNSTHRDAGPVVSVTSTSSRPEPSITPSSADFTKRPTRSGFRKKEVRRMLAEAEVAAPCLEDVEDDTAKEPEALPRTHDASTQYCTRDLQLSYWPRSIAIQANFKPKATVKKRRNFGVQCAPLCKDQSISCKRKLTGPLHSTPKKTKVEESFSFDEEPEEDVSMYDPVDEQNHLNESSHEILPDLPPHQEEKFIVSKSCLWELLEDCPKCGRPCKVEEANRMGTFVSYHQVCSFCEWERRWSSQPFVKNTPAGNLAMSAAILFNGASPVKILRIFRTMRISCISESTYHHHNRTLLQPTILHVWHQHQQQMISQVTAMEGGLVLGGDGRSDSPGHSAKYGSYTMLETRINKVIDIQLVQSNKVGSSVNMEKEGLIRSVAFLKNKKLGIFVIVTDRHPQIQKWIREQLPDTVHYYDVWHVAKSVKRKLEVLAKKKGCEQLYEWIRSICNHLYWCASSSLNASGDVKAAKWKSVAYHVQNQHTDHGDLFPECSHEPIDATVDRKKKWIASNTDLAEKLELQVTNSLLCRDVKKLSPYHQTSSVEAYHSVVNHFCPKMFSYSFKGMLTRLYLAALHYNENSCRPKATNKKGEVIFVIKYPKYKSGGYIVTAKKEAATYGYVENLLKALFELVIHSPDDFAEASSSINVPPPLSSSKDRPLKTVAVNQHISRYSKN